LSAGASHLQSRTEENTNSVVGIRKKIFSITGSFSFLAKATHPGKQLQKQLNWDCFFKFPNIDTQT